MKLFTTNSNGVTFDVRSTYHGNSRRDGALRSRMKYYTIVKLKKIFSLSAQAINKYRDKGRFTITYRTSSGRIGALLCAFDSRSGVTIITALYNVKREPYNVFRGIPHLFLPDYTFTKPTDSELRKDYHHIRAKFSSRK